MRLDCVLSIATVKLKLSCDFSCWADVWVTVVVFGALDALFFAYTGTFHSTLTSTYSISILFTAFASVLIKNAIPNGLSGIVVE